MATAVFDGDYPTTAVMTSYLTSTGIEIIAEDDTDYYTEWRKQMWRMANRTETAGGLSVYSDATGTVKVAFGRYYWGDTYKYYTGSAEITPPITDTLYIWMKDDNTIDSDIDATGWPAYNHIKIAEVSKDATNITNIVDRRPVFVGNIHRGIVCVDNAVVCIDNEVVTT